MRLAPILFVVILGGCWATTPDDEGKTPIQKGGETLMKVAPALPGPLGGIVAGAGTLLALVGSIFAGKRRAAAFEAKGQMGVATLDPVTKVFAERKWLFPLIAGFITAGTGANLWHIDPEVLITLDASLGLPAVGEFVKDAMAAKAASATPAK